jgi:hypothetical protein
VLQGPLLPEEGDLLRRSVLLAGPGLLPRPVLRSGLWLLQRPVRAAQAVAKQSLFCLTRPRRNSALQKPGRERPLDFFRPEEA